MIRMAVLMVVAILAGCAVEVDRQDRAVRHGLHPDDVSFRLGTGQPQSYRAGVRDGCSSGLHFAGHRQYERAKPLATYQTDRAYRDGWDNGYSECFYGITRFSYSR